MKLFLGFVLISGVGWLLDIASYTALAQLLDVAPAYANFASSMVGVTYVWLVSLNKLFDRREYGASIYLPIYWGYQALSILVYSALIALVAESAINVQLSELLGISYVILAKIIITFPNLLTNFVFMFALTKCMQPNNKKQML